MDYAARTHGRGYGRRRTASAFHLLLRGYLPPPMAKEPMDVPEVVEALNRALRLQNRSAAQYTLAAGSISGVESQYLADRLWSFAVAELEDARHLVEKIVTLEGEPTAEVAPLRFHHGARDALAWLVESETEAIDAVSHAIEATGNEGRGEALEHRIEHMIMRKQEQVDFLERARR